MRKLITFAVAAYVIAYMVFRLTHTAIWSENGKEYVIYPEGMTALYYAFRPMAYIDEGLTGMQSHIGEHRRPQS